MKDLDQVRAFSPEKMKKVALVDSPRLFCDLYCFEPGQVQKPHAHQGSDKVYVVLEGRARIRVGTEEREAGPNTITLAPAGTEHGVANAGPDRLVLLVFMAPRPTD